MKDIISKKRKLDEKRVVILSATAIKKKLPYKIQGFGIFSIPCTIGSHEFGKALCDSAVSINLMPFSVVKRLCLGQLTPTTLPLQMTDRSMT